MAVTVHLTPQQQKVLESQAREQGVSLEHYVQQLVEKQVSEVPAKQHANDLETELDGIATHSARIPMLSLDALTREAIYRDR